jgi:hypothetical protein
MNSMIVMTDNKCETGDEVTCVCAWSVQVVFQMMQGVHVESKKHNIMRMRSS